MLTNRLIHIHVPKTAGSALRVSLERAAGGSLRVLGKTGERNVREIDPNQYDVFSGHFGFDTAIAIGGDLVTVLRNPVDRFLSVYYFWRQLHASGAEVSPKTICAAKYTLEEFVRIYDEPFLVEEFFNRATWQIAYGSSIEHRREFRKLGKTEQDVFNAAKENLERFAVLGVQENLPAFLAEFGTRFGIALDIRKTNVTKHRKKTADISVGTLKKIHDWVYLDIELYSCLVAMKSGDGQPRGGAQ
jgi:hypothetical protein